MSNKLLLKGRRALNVVMTAVAAVAIGVAINFAALTSHAETAGTINATGSVNIRADASTTSDIVTTKAGGESIQILGQKTGADGNVWYQIYINATTVGYVRSDFAKITDGSIPDTINADGTVSSIDESVTKVNPVSGEVTGGQAVRVRSDASTSATIVASASSGQSLTVNGKKEGTDGNTWYYVEFADGTTNVKGFIRSDFIELSGDLVEITEEGAEATTTDTDTTAAETTETTVEEQKDYDTELEDGVWYLLDYKTNQKYSIESMFAIIDNAQTESASKSKSGTAKTVWLIIFIIIAIAAIGAAAYFFLKLREANDKEAFAEADKERKARVNAASRPQSGTAQRNAGQQKTQGQQTQRTATANGQRPAQSAGQRTAQSGVAGQRTVNAAGNTQRPVQSGAQRPVQSGAQRPVQSGVQRPVQSGTQRPVQSGAQRPVQSGVQRPVQSGTQNTGASASAQTQNSQAPKNGYDEDDDFEFGFLNWDGDEKK